MVGFPAPFAASLTLPSGIMVLSSSSVPGILIVNMSATCQWTAGTEPNWEIRTSGGWESANVPFTTLGSSYGLGYSGPSPALEWRITGPLTKVAGSLGQSVAFPQSGTPT